MERSEWFLLGCIICCVGVAFANCLVNFNVLSIISFSFFGIIVAGTFFSWLFDV